MYKADTPELGALSSWPDEDYYNTRVNGKELNTGLSEDMLSRLAKATKIDTGVLPDKEDSKWKSIIEPEGSPAKTETSQPINAKRAHDASVSFSVPSSAGVDPVRPSRRGTKRRYNDESFEGYGEGFVDDHVEATSPDVEEGDAGSTAKRKKRRVGRPRKDEASTPISPVSSSPSERARPARIPVERG